MEAALWQECASKIGAASIMEQNKPHTPASMMRADIIADRAGRIMDDSDKITTVSGFKLLASDFKYPICPELQAAGEFRLETLRLHAKCRYSIPLPQVMQWIIIPKRKRILCSRFRLFEIPDLDIDFISRNADQFGKQFACPRPICSESPQSRTHGHAFRTHKIL